MKLQWKKSSDGYTESLFTWDLKGYYEIEPVFAGRTRPIGFTLYFCPLDAPRFKINRYADTQRMAKDNAQYHADGITQKAL